jgi:hypothetical protein
VRLSVTIVPVNEPYYGIVIGLDVFVEFLSRLIPPFVANIQIDGQI